MAEDSRQHTVFVVDDNEPVRRVTMRALESFGFATMGAGDGYEAVKAFREHWSEVDCLILDMSMPGMDGEETLHSLREIDDSVPVLLASGHSADELRQTYGHSGFTGFLQKPFEVGALAELVKQAIGSRIRA